MEYLTLEVIIKDRIATVCLNRPEVYNAFNIQMLSDLTDVFAKLSDAEDIIAILLKGNGKSFCSGADLNWMKSAVNNTYDANFSESMVLARCFYMIYTCRKPTIALVHGVALGGANGLLAACDMAFCDHETTFSLSEVKIGIIPACISPYVIKRIGEYGAKDLMLTGRRIKGREAEWYRLVNKSLPTDQVEEYITAIISQLKTSGPMAISHCKNLVYQISNTLTIDQVHEFTAKMIADIRASDEGQEGIASFLEKRKPNWVKE